MLNLTPTPWLNGLRAFSVKYEMNTASLKDIVDSMVHSPVRQYVLPGLTSLIVGGDGHGMVRLLDSDRDTREWVTPHSHRFDFSCLVLEGEVENILFQQFPGMANPNHYSAGTLSPVEGGLGKYKLERSGIPQLYAEVATWYHGGEFYSMKSNQIHSIRFASRTKVLFFESPNVSETSVILEPYSNGKVIETFQAKDWMFDHG